jgi:hypothetical protein
MATWTSCHWSAIARQQLLEQPFAPVRPASGYGIEQLGGAWYENVLFWWLVFVSLVLGLIFVLSGLFL